MVPGSSFALEETEQDSQIPGKQPDINQDSYFYYYGGMKKQLELNPKFIFVSSNTKNGIAESKINSRVQFGKVSNLRKNVSQMKLQKPNNFKVKHPERYWREIELTNTQTEKQYLDQIEDLRSNSDMIVAPYFTNETGIKVGLSNYFLVKLKTPDDFETLVKQINKYDLELVGYNKYMPLWFTVSVTPQSEDALQMANTFYETGLFQHVEPDFLLVPGLPNAPNPAQAFALTADTFYPNQWHLNNTGQNNATYAGIDINAEAAWTISTGDINTSIAIFDQGLENNHPDLAANIVNTGYDLSTDSSPTVISGPHGVPCGGIAAGVANNGIGISGVAYNSGLFSIGWGNDPAGYQEFANGFNWAVNNGADVISNSWTWAPSSILDDAITNALTTGRGGLGSVVVFATGNSDVQDVAYPADSNPDILAVGAMSYCGERMNEFSCDGQDWWGSNYGTELDIVAPGVDIGATDLQGAAGYDATDYTLGFNGTSSATPIVAGVAALVISTNPNLTAVEVNTIIEESAQKVRPDLYGYQTTGGRPNGTWNIQMGYGLVDAHQAVLLAEDFQDCPWSIAVNGLGTSQTFVAEYSITSIATTSANSGNFVFNAGNHIRLLPGFLATSQGNTFHAFIDGCTNVNNDDEDITFREKSDEIEYDYNSVDLSPLNNTDVDRDNPLLTRNYPNPFSGKTNIEYVLPEANTVSIIVRDITGRQVAQLVNNEYRDKGKHSVSFDGSRHSVGLYSYTIKAGRYSQTRKMILER